MSIPPPRPGSVIRYAYLWHDEARRGREEGAKDRPCAVVLTTMTENDETTVIVAPITHTPPPPNSGAVPLPPATQRRLGLDDDPCWIITREVNRFVWPGVDVRPVLKGRDKSWTYGVLPLGVLKQVQSAFREMLHERRLRAVKRDF